MKNLIIKPQSQTPEINFNPNNGQLLISGRVYPTHTIKFFTPLIEWCKKYVSNSENETELICEIEYLDSASQKQLIDLLLTLKPLKKFVIRWRYEKAMKKFIL